MLQRFVNLSWSSSLSAQWHEKQIKMLSDGINLEQTKILTSVFFEITNTIKLSALENSPSWIESSWGCYWGLIEFSWPKFNLPKLFNELSFSSRNSSSFCSTSKSSTDSWRAKMRRFAALDANLNHGKIFSFTLLMRKTFWWQQFVVNEWANLTLI